MLTLIELATSKVDPKKLKLKKNNFNVVANNGMKFININERHLTRNQIIKSGVLNNLNNIVENHKHFSNPRYIRALGVFKTLHNKVYKNNHNAAPTSYVVAQHAIPYLEYFDRYASNIIYKNEKDKVNNMKKNKNRTALRKASQALRDKKESHRKRIVNMIKHL